MTSAGNASQGKMAAAQSLSGRLLKIYLRRIIKTPKFMRWVLNTWEPSGEEGTRFLQLLTEEMTPEWWRQQRPAVKKQILGELIRIDDGRGIIADWLAWVVRMENDVSVLELAARWESLKYCFTDQLLDAWHERSLDSLSNTHAIQKIALKVIVNAILSSDMSQEKAEERMADESIWNEEQRAKIILRYLEKQHLVEQQGTPDLKEAVEKLEIMVGWEPPPELHGKEILYEIFHEWEKHMQDIANIITKDEKGYYKIWGICDPRFSHTVSDERFIQQRYLWVTWKGLIKLSPHCPGTSDQLLMWIKYWLQRVKLVALEVENEMTGWNPPDDEQQEQVAILWSRYLLSYHGHTNPAVWKAVGRYFAKCQKPDSGMKEICHNCLQALEWVEKTHDELKAYVMKAIVCPAWLTAEQQAEWKRLWVSLMWSSSENAVQTAARHLLGLVTNGLADRNDVKKDILKRLEKLNTGKYMKIIDGLLDEIGQWEGDESSPGEMFYDVWVQLRECLWWEKPEVRRVAIKTLALCLGKKLKSGKEAHQLVSLWLETLRGERNSEVFSSLQAGQREIMKIHPGFCPDSVAVWKQLVRNGNPKIRRMTWELFLSLRDEMGNEAWLLLKERLPKEKTLNVLQVMVQWRPPSGKPLPAEFGKEWANCLQKVAVDAAQSFVSGQAWCFNMQQRMGNVISIAKNVIKNFAMTWLEEQLAGNEQLAKPAELRIFWETMAETMTSFSDREVVGEIKGIQKNMDALFRLDESPEKFLNSFAVMNAHDKKKAPGDDFWEDLIKCLKGRNLEVLPVNVRHNLGVVAAFLLGQERDRAEELQQIFVELCGDGTWTPDRIPAGWEEFCHELRRFCTMYDKNGMCKPSEPEMKKVCAMARIGNAVKDMRCQRLFQQTLFQILDATGPDLAPVIESMVWRKVVGGCEMAEQLAPDGKGLEEIGRQRWLRELFRNHKEISDGCEGNGGIREFFNFLWMELKKNTFFQETTGYREGNEVKVLALDSREAVFVHPHRDGNCPAEVPDRLVGTKPVGQRVPRQSFFLTE